MNKLTLDVNALAVESFEPAVQTVTARGTVQAREAARTLSFTQCHTNCSCPPTPLI
jgi:hypothetical protein